MTFVSVRLARMQQYIESNPYVVYGEHRDVISDKMANMILKGLFVEFQEEFFEIEMNITDDVNWTEWNQAFAQEFGYDEWDDMPSRIQELAEENRYIDSIDVLKTSIRNWDGNVIARLRKRNGEYIEFPCYYYDDETNKNMKRYLKEMCGITGDSENSYANTYLTVLGKVDLYKIYQSQTKPEEIWIDSNCRTIGHEPYNGSGTMANDQYNGKRRKMKADFFLDNKCNGYGVDSIYGFVPSHWANNLEIVC